MAATYVKEEKLAAVLQFDCNGCGNALDVVNKRAKFVACPYCGTQYDASSEVVQELSGKFDDPSKHPPESFVRVGMTARFDGKKYQVIARTRVRQIYKEYWAEDGETGYSDEVWVYDEWLLISEQRTYFYLIEDVDGFHISKEVIPSAPSLPQHHEERWSFETDVYPQIIREMGRGHILFFEGESNYEVKIDDQVGFALYQHRRNLYSAEWRYDEATQELKEIEFFEEVPIGRMEVMEAFEANAAIQELNDKVQLWRWLRNAALGLSLFALVAGMSTCNQPFDPVLDVTYSLEEAADEEGVLTETFDLEPGLYSLTLSGQHSEINADGFAMAYILAENDDVVNTVEAEMWVYEGWEDGYWREESSLKEKIVKVTEPGRYRARIFADKPEGATGKVRFEVLANAHILRYYIILFWLGLVAALIFHLIKRQTLT